MGYTGHVIIKCSGIPIFNYNEWKHSNTEYCFTYAKNWIFTKGEKCKVTAQSLKKALSGFYFYRVKKSDRLKALMDLLFYVYRILAECDETCFDLDGMFLWKPVLLKVKSKYADLPENVVAFYYGNINPFADAVGRVLDDYSLININSKRFIVVPNILKNSDEIAERLSRISVRQNVLDVIEFLKELISEESANINEFYDLQSRIEEFCNNVNACEDPYVVYLDGYLQLYADEHLETFIMSLQCSDSMFLGGMLSDLGFRGFGAQTIITGNEIDSFIDSFQLIPSQDRLPELEASIKEIASSQSNEKLLIEVEGGY